jgi:ATP-dependent RNA helicase RhlE
VSYCSPEEEPLLQAIEKYLEKEITVMKIGKGDYQETLAASEDIPNTNWKLLLEEEEKRGSEKKKKRK